MLDRPIKRPRLSSIQSVSPLPLYSHCVYDLQEPPLAFIASPAQLLHRLCIGLRSFGFLTFLLCSMVGECSRTWFIQCPDPPSRCLVPSTHRISFAILTTVTSPASAGDRK